MYNLIVLGCGRSGTSMVTGTLATGGYCTGNDNWQMFDRTALPRLEQFAQVKLDRHFPDPRLYKASPRVQYKGEVARVYKELCQRANFDYS